MDRRRYVALVGGGAGSLTGCTFGLSGDADRAPESTPTQTNVAPTADLTSTAADETRVQMGDAVTIDDRQWTVSDPALRKGILGEGPHGPTLWSSAGQYVVVNVTAGDEPAGSERVESSIDGEQPSDAEQVRETVDGRIAVPFPVGQHQSAAVGLGFSGRTVRWKLPGPIRDALARHPSFEIEALSLPERGGQFELSLTVRNIGDRDGTFVAEVSPEAFSGHEIVEFPVPAGDSHTYSGTANGMVTVFEGNGGGTLTLAYPGTDGVVEESVEKEIAESTTASDGS